MGLGARTGRHEVLPVVAQRGHHGLGVLVDAEERVPEARARGRLGAARTEPEQEDPRKGDIGRVGRQRRVRVVAAERMATGDTEQLREVVAEVLDPAGCPEQCVLRGFVTGAGRPADAEVDPSRMQRLQRPELLGDVQGRDWAA
jgi:hypothetical protein